MSKNIFAIVKRLLNVIYAFLLLGTILFTLIIWDESKPEKNTTYSYEVICDNGKKFDPTSKPIRRLTKNDEGVYRYDHGYSSNKTFLYFDSDQIKSECEFGKSWPYSTDLPENYQLIVHKNIPSKINWAITTIKALFISNFLLEIFRIIFLYVFFGKNFLTLKPIKK